MPNNDDDILSQLEEIDTDEVVGEEVPLDEDLDLDFEDEGVPTSKPKATEQPKATELTGSAIRIGGPAPSAKPEPLRPKKTQKARAGGAEPKAAAVMPPAPQPQAAKPRHQDAPAADAPVAATATVQEMVLHAKTLRIVADKVVIEPKSVSIS